MAASPLDENIYPEPLVSRPRGGSGLWRVVALAIFLIALASAYAIFSDRIPADAMLLALGLLAVVGVFCLFALAAGLFRFAGNEEKRTLASVIVDSLPFGAVVTDREGKISYVNAEYGNFAGGISNGVPVSVTRLFAGQPEASEAVYRLSRAAQDGRSATEDIRLVGGLDGTAADFGRPFWYRVAVRPLPEIDRSEKPLVLWSVEEITRDRERQENAFLELQRAIDYLDHAPAGFFSADADGRVQYLNSTLADWLGYDLAEFEAGTVRLTDICRGDSASLLMRGRGDG
ncbi:MAG: PAS domain-containing protein, partial [Devosia nanyangense]|nr:PAS domain-containing protein [Devosia nanyangense]